MAAVLETLKELDQAVKSKPFEESSAMSRIADIRGREIIDSRGNPTVEADVILDVRRAGPRGGALGRIHRHARGGRAARWR